MVKFYVYLLFCILFINNICLSYSGGSGTETDPFQISNTTDLQLLMNTNSDWNKHFILTNDIDCAGMTGATPIGVSWNVTFNGSFNGQNYIISNLTIDHPDSILVGLFGFNDGNIKNRGLSC